MFVRLSCLCYFFFFFKQKTAYEMRISDWSSDVCSSDLGATARTLSCCARTSPRTARPTGSGSAGRPCNGRMGPGATASLSASRTRPGRLPIPVLPEEKRGARRAAWLNFRGRGRFRPALWRSEEHTSELQSLMRISYAVFCLKKKRYTTTLHSLHHYSQKQ